MLAGTKTETWKYSETRLQRTPIITNSVTTNPSYNELGYNELCYNDHSAITKKLIGPKWSF